MLAYPLETSFTYKNKTIRLNLSFDAVLRFFNLQKDEEFTVFEKLDLCLEMFVKHYKFMKLTQDDKTAVMRFIFDNFITIPSKKSNDDTHTVDFNQDADYIYSAFMQAYNLDLTKLYGQLDWRKFIALFKGLPEGTKIREIMEIRARKYPPQTEHNREEIKALREAKAFYALDISQEEQEKEFQKSLDKFGAALEARAKRK